MNWHRWFAWHPVTLRNGHFVWLRFVERKWDKAQSGHSVSGLRKRVGVSSCARLLAKTLQNPAKQAKVGKVARDISA